MPNQKGLAPIVILLGILAVVLLGGLLYFSGSQNNKSQQTGQNYSAPQSPIGNWKNFSSLQPWLGLITLQYPGNWNLKKLHKSGFPNFVEITSQDKNSCIKMTLTSESKDSSFDKLFPTRPQGLDSPKFNYKILNTKETSFNGYKTKTRELEGKDAKFKDAVMLLGPDPRPELKNNNVYILASSCSMKEAAEFDQILSTIKLNREQLKWVSYKNGDEVMSQGVDLGFNIKVPKGWEVNYMDSGDNGYVENTKFDLIPPGWQKTQSFDSSSGWGEITINIYPSVSSPEEWMKKFSTQGPETAFLPHKTISTGNDKVAFVDNDSSNYNLVPPIKIEKGYIVLGTNYSFLINISSQNKPGSVQPDFVPDDIMKYFYAN